MPRQRDNGPDNSGKHPQWLQHWGFLELHGAPMASAATTAMVGTAGSILKAMETPRATCEVCDASVVGNARRRAASQTPPSPHGHRRRNPLSSPVIAFVTVPSPSFMLNAPTSSSIQQPQPHCQDWSTVTANVATISLDISCLAGKAKGSKDWRDGG